LAESAELGCIAKPAAFVFFRRGGGIGYAVVFHLGKSGLGEKRDPFGSGKQMRGDAQNFAPLMRVFVLAVVVDEQPSLAPFAQDALNFPQSGEGIRPIIGGFHGDRVVEEVGVPGKFFRLADDEHGVFEIGVAAASAANHLVRNIHAYDSTFGHLLGKQARQPTRAAADIQDIIFGREAHAVEYGKHDRQMILLHALAAARFRPAIKFLAKRFGISSGIGRCFHLPIVAFGLPSSTVGYIPASSAEGP